jgi:2-isopropylmalate synthase
MPGLTGNEDGRWVPAGAPARGGAGLPSSWVIDCLHTTTRIDGVSTATVRIRRPDGEVVQDAAISKGPVGAVFRAIERATKIPIHVRAFNVVGSGSDMETYTVAVEVIDRHRSFGVQVSRDDMITAAAQAYIDCTNIIYRHLAETSADLGP